MTSALVPWRGRQVPDLSQISRYNLTDFFGWLQESFKFGGHTYSPSPAVSYTYGRQASEPIGNNFAAYVQGGLFADGPVAAAEAYRLRVFGQAPLLFQERRDGRPGDLYDDDSLDLLREPWVGGTTGDLEKRALVYGDFAGNAYLVVIDDEVVLLRPDWVEIILERRMWQGSQVGWRQVGISYTEGGLGNGDAAVFVRGEYAHFTPYIPDPLATYRGMSWMTPIIREIQSDIGATTHGKAFWENAATPNLAVSLPKEITPTQFEEFVEKMDAQHRGAYNAYKTLYTAGGADVTVVGANMQTMDFSRVQGKIETRIANASGVPAVLLGFSEGMQGSSLNAGNYQSAKRNFVDTTMRDLWQNFCGSLKPLFPAPTPKARLWYDARDIPFLHEDQKDAADIQHVKAQVINAFVMNGFDPASAIASVDADDRKLLKHTGLVSVQLLPPGAKDSDGDGHVDSESEEEDQYQDALKAARAEFDQGDGISRAYYNIRHPAGAVGGGRFRKISDIIVKALEEWMNGGGDDDPLDEFTQPQLKAAATQLGLDPPPRTRAPALRKMLLDKARADVRAQREEGPSDPAPSGVVAVSDLRPGDYVHVEGRDKFLSPTKSTGWVEHVSPSTIRKRGRKTGEDVLIVDLRFEYGELGSGNAGEGRHRVIVSPDAKAEKRTPPSTLNEKARELVTDKRLAPTPAKPSAEQSIRDAYAALQRRPGDWVPLAAIRERLGGRDRAEVDTALESLAVTPGVQVIPWDNFKALSKADREAALRFGGQDNHAIRIEPTLTPAPSDVVPDKARARQARIDSARGVATSLAEALELVNNDASPEAYKSRVNATAKRLGTPDSVRDALLNAQGDPVKLRAAVRKAAKAAGLTQVGDPRKPVPFDRALHKAIDGDITPGALVSVVRPGFDVDVDGERVRLSPASVIAAPVKAPRAKAAPRKPSAKQVQSDVHPEIAAFRAMSKDERLRDLRAHAEAANEDPFALLHERNRARALLGSLSVEELRELSDAHKDWRTSEAHDRGLLTRLIINETGLNPSYDPALGRNRTHEEQVAHDAARKAKATTTQDKPAPVKAPRAKAAPKAAKATTPKLTQSDILADPNLSPAQKRQRLRSLGLSKAEIDALVPLPPRKSAKRAEDAVADDIVRAMNDDELRDYWTKGEGLKKWLGHPHPWTTLRNHIRKYVGQERANRIASQWFHLVTGMWPGERKGDNPVGPG